MARPSVEPRFSSRPGRDWCENDALGHRVEDLPLGDEWESLADRLCRPGNQDYRAECEQTMAYVLATWAQEAKLVLKLAEAEDRSRPT